MESKRLAPLRILEILHTYSDPDRPLRQQDIIYYLHKDYDLDLGRKAVGDHLSALKEAGFEIERQAQGSFLARRPFEDSELRLLIDGVLSSRHVPASYSKDLIKRLSKLSNIYFSAHVSHITNLEAWNKVENPELFLCIERVDQAIEDGRQIAFDYYKFNLDKELVFRSSQQVSPYQMLLHNQRYYLMAYNEKKGHMAFYRIDRIKNMEVLEDQAATDLRTIPGYEQGIDYADLANARPYMYSDPVERIEMVADAAIIDQIVDWFGTGIEIQPIQGDPDRIKVSFKASPLAMAHWAIQYINRVEIFKPGHLRQTVRERLEKGLEKYQE